MIRPLTVEGHRHIGTGLAEAAHTRLRQKKVLRKPKINYSLNIEPIPKRFDLLKTSHIHLWDSVLRYFKNAGFTTQMQMLILLAVC